MLCMPGLQQCAEVITLIAELWMISMLRNIANEWINGELLFETPALEDV
jgi:hypothetical protein